MYLKKQMNLIDTISNENIMWLFRCNFVDKTNPALVTRALNILLKPDVFELEFHIVS